MDNFFVCYFTLFIAATFAHDAVDMVQASVLSRGHRNHRDVLDPAVAKRLCMEDTDSRIEEVFDKECMCDFIAKGEDPDQCRKPALVNGPTSTVVMSKVRGAHDHVSEETSETDVGFYARAQTDLGYQLRLRKGSTKPKRKNAFATLVCNENWLPGTLALAASLRHSKSTAKADVVVLFSHGDVDQCSASKFGINFCSDWCNTEYWACGVSTLEGPDARNLDQADYTCSCRGCNGCEEGSDHNELFEEGDAVDKLFDRVYEHVPIRPHPSITRQGGDCVTLKLQLWDLPYDNVLFIDSDVIALQDLSPLFKVDGDIVAVKDTGLDHEFNSGVFVLRPDKEVFAALAEELKVMPDVHVEGENVLGGDQRFLNKIFYNYTEMDTKYNMFTRDANIMDIESWWEDPKKSPYAALHYSGDWGAADAKPWQSACNSTSDSTSHNESHIPQLLKLWSQAFAEGQANGWIPADYELDCKVHVSSIDSDYFA